MTQAELFEILANGENSGVEFKRDDVRPEQLAKECVALLNLRGGYIFLGVEDDGTITGLMREDCEEWIMDTVFGRYIKPQTIPYYEEMRTEQGQIGIISLEQGIAKPYVVTSQERDDIYIRTGKVSKLANREIHLRLIQEGGHFHIESLPVNGTSIADLDLERFKWYYQKNYESDQLSEQALLEETLEKLDFLTEKQGQGYAATISGLLLFGEAPSHKLPQAGFRLISYQGNQRDLNADHDELVDGPVVAIMQNRETVKSGLMNRVMDRLQSLLSSEQFGNDGITRFREWVYPREVLRELLVNAVAHRDWTKNNTNKVEIFTNRIEITSAGAIPNTLTIDKIKAGVQYPRNPNIIRVLRDVGIMEDRGMGIRRKVIPLLKEGGFADPEFEDTEDFFKVIIYKRDS